MTTHAPYLVGGVPTAPSNEAFDVSLRGRNDVWGVRDIDALQATDPPWILHQTTPMPANHLP